VADTTSARLGEHVDLLPGFAFKSVDFLDNGGEYSLVRGDNIGQGRLRLGDAKMIGSVGSRELRYELAVDDVVIAMDRPWIEAGLKFARVREDDLPSLLVQRVARLRARNSLDQRYLAYVIGSHHFAEYVKSVQTGSAVPHISGSQIEAFSLSLPDLPSQRAIADVLGALDDKIAANTKLAATADELGLSLVRREIATGQVDEVPLSSMADIVMGSSPKGDAINDVGEGVVFHQGIRDFGLRTPTTRLWTTVPTRVADSGDILVSVRAPVGEVNVASSPLCIGRGLAAVKSVDGRSATLLGVMRASRDVWEPFNSEGTVFGSINRAQLHDVRLPRVRAEVAEGLEDALASLEETIRSIEVTNVQLSAVRDALLPALMSGRLTVADL